ncbi:MAG: hypothetical protein NTY12_05280 [Candidatus Falkowbacteria bacterium]|nr:hypothetical protein [Candidatus Falkowbacteria bacterium]
MNKNKLILPVGILLGFFILGGVYYVAQSKRQAAIDKQEADLRMQTEIFNKNMECAKLINDINARIKKIKESAFLVREIELKDLFYSKKINSCLYVTEYYDSEIANGPYYIVLNDALANTRINSAAIGFPNSNEEYFNKDGSENPSGWKKVEEFYKLVNTYK